MGWPTDLQWSPLLSRSEPVVAGTRGRLKRSAMRVGLDRLWLVIAIGLPVLVALLVPLPAVDLAYQVRAGDEILRTAALPASTPGRSRSPGTPWRTSNGWPRCCSRWATGSRLGAARRAARRARRRSPSAARSGARRARRAGPRMAAILALVGVRPRRPALALRPQLFGIAIFAALLWLSRSRARPLAYLVAPLLVMLWANVHG